MITFDGSGPTPQANDGSRFAIWYIEGGKIEFSWNKPGTASVFKSISALTEAGGAGGGGTIDCDGYLEVNGVQQGTVHAHFDLMNAGSDGSISATIGSYQSGVITTPGKRVSGLDTLPPVTP